MNAELEARRKIAARLTAKGGVVGIDPPAPVSVVKIRPPKSLADRVQFYGQQVECEGKLGAQELREIADILDEQAAAGVPGPRTGIYLSAVDMQFRGLLDLAFDPLTLLLVTSDYQTDFAAHQTIADVAAAEVSADGGYSRKLLTRQRIERDEATNEIALHADPVSWLEANFTARAYIIASGDYLIGCVDFGADMEAADGAFRITWTADGIIRLRGVK